MPSRRHPEITVAALAEELGISADAIVQKCRHEEIPDVRSAQSIVSFGLAETVREWFRSDQLGDPVPA